MMATGNTRLVRYIGIAIFVRLPLSASLHQMAAPQFPRRIHVS